MTIWANKTSKSPSPSHIMSKMAVSISSKNLLKVQQVGLAKKQDLKSYTALVFKIDGNNVYPNTKALLCESNSATTQIPFFGFDVSASGDVKCPQGYSPVRD